MPEEEQQQKQAVAMPKVNTNLLAADDYIYESKPLPGKEEKIEAQNTQSGGMSSQFSIVSSPLDGNI